MLKLTRTGVVPLCLGLPNWSSSRDACTESICNRLSVRVNDVFQTKVTSSVN